MPIRIKNMFRLVMSREKYKMLVKTMKELTIMEGLQGGALKK
jgi:hypothetical protein